MGFGVIPFVLRLLRCNCGYMYVAAVAAFCLFAVLGATRCRMIGNERNLVVRAELLHQSDANFPPAQFKGFILWKARLDESSDQ